MERVLLFTSSLITSIGKLMNAELKDYIAVSIERSKLAIENAKEQLDQIERGCVSPTQRLSNEYVLKYESFNLAILEAAQVKMMEDIYHVTR